MNEPKAVSSCVRPSTDSCENPTQVSKRPSSDVRSSIVKVHNFHLLYISKLERLLSTCGACFLSLFCCIHVTVEGLYIIHRHV